MGNPAIFPFRQRFPDDEIMPPPMPPGMEADPSAFSSDPEEQEIQPEPAPGLMPMPEAPNPAETSTDQQIGNPPPPMPSQNPAAMDGMKKMGTITPDGTNPSAPPPPPPPAQPPAAGTMPPPPPPVGSEASEAPDPTWQGSGDQTLPSLAQPKAAMPPPPPPSASAAAWQNLQALGAPPPPPKPNIWQRLGAAALAGAAGYANQRDFKAPPIDTSQGVDNILRPGYAAKLGAYNQQLSAAKDQLNQADKYEDLQSREAQRAALAEQESARAGQWASDAKTRAATETDRVAQLHFKAQQSGWQPIQKGQPVPPGYFATTLGGQDYAVPTNDTVDQKKWISVPDGIAEKLGIEKGKKYPPDFLKTVTAMYDTAYKTDNRSDPVKTEVKQLQKNGRPHQILINSATGEEMKDLGESGERPPVVNVNAASGQLDRETQRYAKPYEKGVADASTQLEKIDDARAMINGSAEAQALGIPKVLTALVSGAGSGVRITQPELNAIATARGVQGGAEGLYNSLTGKGKLTSTQQQQITQILDDVKARITQKQAIHNQALDAINSANSREEIIKIDRDARAQLQQVSKGGKASVAPTPFGNSVVDDLLKKYGGK